MLTVALLTAFATSVHNGALKPPAVFSATFGTPWTLAGVVGHAIEAYVEVNDERIALAVRTRVLFTMCERPGQLWDKD